MTRRSIPWMVAGALVAGAAAWWWEVGRPQQQAFEIAEILSMRDFNREAFDTGLAGGAERLWAEVRGRTPIDDGADRMKWALEELQTFSKRHPRALLHAALVEKSETARTILLDAIAGSDAFRSAPLDLRLDTIFDPMGLLKLDHGFPLQAPQIDALREGREMVRPRLHAALRQGHCGALTALAALGDSAAPGEIADALAANQDPMCVAKMQSALRQAP